MLPDLSLLIGLFLGLQQLYNAAGADADPLRALAGTAAAVVVVAALCRLAADRAISAVEERDAEALLRSGRFATLWPFTGWLACLYVFDWGTYVAQTIPREWWMVPHLVLLTPLALMFAAGWASVQRVQARFTPNPPTPWAAIEAGLRRNALVLAPFLVLTAVLEAFGAMAALGVPGVRRLLLLHEAFRDVESLVVLAMMAVLAWFAPAVIRRVLRSRPLPAGELRTQIERLCEKLGVRYRDILLWETDGRVLNAMVVGLTGRTRFVFVTDALIDALPLPEVLAVVAHEAGHARLRHLPAYFAVSIASLLLMRTAQEMLPWLFGGPELLLELLFLGFFWFVMLGWLSRRFERQADVFGAEHAGALVPDAPPVVLPGAPVSMPYGAATMIAALDRVVAHAGPGRSHRHGTPAQRTAFLAAYATDESVRRGFEQDTRRLRATLRAFVGIALVLTAVRIPAGFERGEAYLRLEEGRDATVSAHASRKAGKADDANASYDRAHASFLEAARRAEKRPDDLAMKGLVVEATFDAADLDVHHRGRLDDAKAGFERVLSLLKDLDLDDSLQGKDIAFQSHIELGRIALRGPAEAAGRENGVAAAKKHLTDAQHSDASDAKPYNRSRVRLLENAIRLRDPDADVAAQARRDLERLKASMGKGPEWDELAADADEELRLVPPR